jgi:FolB domain-containing protein
MDKIFITDLLARGIIGVNHWERQKPQDILINITLFTDLHTAGLSDDIKNTVSYSHIAKIVLIHIQSACRFTVEALAEDIAQLCLAETGIKSVCVRVEKPGAVRFTRSVGVEIERSNL